MLWISEIRLNLSLAI